MFLKVSFELICWMFPVQSELWTHCLPGIDNFQFNYLQYLELKINLNCQAKPLRHLEPELAEKNLMQFFSTDRNFIQLITHLSGDDPGSTCAAPQDKGELADLSQTS